MIAVLAGLFTTAHGLHHALDLFVPILAAAALISAGLSAYDARRRALASA